MESVKVNILSGLLVLYGWILCYTARIFQTCGYYIMNYFPNSFVPNSPHIQMGDKELIIDNFQYDMEDITKKVKIFLHLMGESEMRMMTKKKTKD